MLRTKQQSDPIFGKIEYRKPLFHSGFWQGKVNFSSLENPVNVYIAAGKEGVLESQQEFYLELERRYPGMSEEIGKALINSVGFEIFRGKDPLVFFQEFELQRIFIPEPKEPSNYWQLSYLFPQWKHTVTIYFNGWTAYPGEIDD